MKLGVIEVKVSIKKKIKHDFAGIEKQSLPSRVGADEFWIAHHAK